MAGDPHGKTQERRSLQGGGGGGGLYTAAGRPMELGGEETLVAQSDAYQKDDVWVIDVKVTTG